MNIPTREACLRLTLDRLLATVQAHASMLNYETHTGGFTQTDHIGIMRDALEEAKKIEGELGAIGGFNDCDTSQITLIRVHLPAHAIRKLREVANKKQASYAVTVSDIVEEYLDAQPCEKSTLIFSREHSTGAACWWGPDAKGYTEDINQAGRYTPGRADYLCRLSHGDSVPILESVARSLPACSIVFTREVENILANVQDHESPEHGGDSK